MSETLPLANITLAVRNFRAISEAHIKIDGITVVAGLNGSGKSTLSKLLYYVFYVNNNLADSVATEMNSDLAMFERAIVYLIQSYNISARKYMNFRTSLADVLDDFKFNIGSSNPFVNEATADGVLDYLDSLSDFLSSLNTKEQDLSRVTRIFFGIFNKSKDKELPRILKSESNSHLELIKFLRNYILELQNKWNNLLAVRPKYLLDLEIKRAFNTSNKPEFLEVIEYGVPIVSDGVSMKIPFEIEDVLYIDTPMLLGMDGVKHWNHTNEKINTIIDNFNIDNFNYSEPIQNLINHDVLQGNGLIEYDETRTCFVFKNTENNFIVDLEDCATGIKAFGIINILLKNGSINDKTLLILDEPETHLHPQWIVEYARLLTLIQKYVGTKIFVVTHNPDMVQSLKYIPMKENIGNNVTFYNAVPVGENLQYQYNELGDDIHDIFNSFNVSYDKLELYGSDSNEI